ncbi:MAG: VCBS repeat-containing protein [Candidatus Syntrophosphaera sp.]|nr:VCBS repeat-containing protein [Candidatus Syntrophosphaera sp.]
MIHFKKVVLALLLMGASLTLPAQNHMDVILDLEGNQWYDHFGIKLAALDFNGDGFDDLAVLQSWWVPDSLDAQLGAEYVGRNWGRILFYYGGPGFDGIPDFTIEGERPNHFRYAGVIERFASLGDMNGDGYDDLGIFDYPNRIAVYFGGAAPSTQPGFMIDPIPDATTNSYFSIMPCGDLNDDGYDDLAYFFNNDSYTGYGSLRLVFGGTFQELVVAETYVGNYEYRYIHGIGDINSDGFGDYVMTIFQQGGGQMINSAYLGYGGPQIDPTDAALFSEVTYASCNMRRPLGDVNGDGYADFVGLMDGLIKCWYGGQSISADYDLSLYPYYQGGGASDHGLVHGDLNGDGYEDVIGADPRVGYFDGRACVWLGGANMNGTADLFINAWAYGMQMGLGIASGDFNADGCDDLAISCPTFPDISSFPGRLRVYAGNPQLADTTTGIEEEVMPGIGWYFRALPNPLPGGSGLRLRFYGSGYEACPGLELKICNLRGQLVYSGDIAQAALERGEMEIGVLKLAAGVYIAELSQGGQKLQSAKFTVK